MHVADDVHHFGHVGFGAAFVDNRQIHVEHFRHGTRAHHAADVGADHHQVVDALLHDVVGQDGRGVNIVHGHVEEALDLVGVQVHGQYAVDACGFQHIGHQFGGNRYAGGTRTAVLARIAEIGNGGGNPSGGGAFQGIGHGEDFHQVVVGGRTSGLEDEHIAAAHVFQ